MGDAVGTALGRSVATRFVVIQADDVTSGGSVVVNRGVLSTDHGERGTVADTTVVRISAVVSESVGIEVGAGLGDVVGPCVGNAVGVKDGDDVGGVLGEPIGLCVGNKVGAATGDTVG